MATPVCVIRTIHQVYKFLKDVEKQLEKERYAFEKLGFSLNKLEEGILGVPESEGHSHYHDIQQLKMGVSKDISNLRQWVQDITKPEKVKSSTWFSKSVSFIKSFCKKVKRFIAGDSERLEQEALKYNEKLDRWCQQLLFLVSKVVFSQYSNKEEQQAIVRKIQTDADVLISQLSEVIANEDENVSDKEVEDLMDIDEEESDDTEVDDNNNKLDVPVDTEGDDNNNKLDVPDVVVVQKQIKSERKDDDNSVQINNNSSPLLQKPVTKPSSPPKTTLSSGSSKLLDNPINNNNSNFWQQWFTAITSPIEATLKPQKNYNQLLLETRNEDGSLIMSERDVVYRVGNGKCYHLGHCIIGKRDEFFKLQDLNLAIASNELQLQPCGHCAKPALSPCVDRDNNIFVSKSVQQRKKGCYHHKGCPSMVKGGVFTISLQMAIDNELVPCKKCSPISLHNIMILTQRSIESNLQITTPNVVRKLFDDEDDNDVYVTAKGRTYHKVDCYTIKSSTKSKVSIKKAESDGKSACKKCFKK